MIDLRKMDGVDGVDEWVEGCRWSGAVLVGRNPFGRRRREWVQEPKQWIKRPFSLWTLIDLEGHSLHSTLPQNKLLHQRTSREIREQRKKKQTWFLEDGQDSCLLIIFTAGALDLLSNDARSTISISCSCSLSSPVPFRTPCRFLNLPPRSETIGGSGKRWTMTGLETEVGRGWISRVREGQIEREGVACGVMDLLLITAKNESSPR